MDMKFQHCDASKSILNQEHSAFSNIEHKTYLNNELKWAQKNPQQNKCMFHTSSIFSHRNNIVELIGYSTMIDGSNPIPADLVYSRTTPDSVIP